MDIAEAGLKFGAERGVSDSGRSWREEEFVVVGFQRTVDKPCRLILAREVGWDLELATTASIQLPELDRRKLNAQLERLRTDYPHLEVNGQRAEWVRPLIRVRARYRDDGNGPRGASITALRA